MKLWKDKKGAKNIAKNGMMSCTGKSRHIGIRYFWLNDRVKHEKFVVEHCPTEKMIAVFLRNQPRREVSKIPKTYHRIGSYE
mmetsp:Transcript_14953/g.14428  ORF Transcript_14953/g.14428 Transcript_14953/m.14428 type:complete len:82 (+) Transcript_14953:24-269(+)